MLVSWTQPGSDGGRLACVGMQCSNVMREAARNMQFKYDLGCLELKDAVAIRNEPHRRRFAAQEPHASQDDLAPTCRRCGIRIVGHGLEKDGTFYCCDHCAEKDGVSGLRDRV
jgi:hypothetical protein